MRRFALLLLGSALLGAAAVTTLDVEFRNADGVVYRTSQLGSQLPGLTPRVLIVQSPSIDDDRLRRQEQLFPEHSWEELQLLLVISLHDGTANHGYFTDPANSKRVAASLGAFGVALLDASGRVLLKSAEPIAPSLVRPPLQLSAALHETRQELVVASLLKTLGSAYPGPDPLSCKKLAPEEETPGFVQVAVRESHQLPCGGDPGTEPVIDRFRVLKPVPTVQRYDAVEDKWVSLGLK